MNIRPIPKPDRFVYSLAVSLLLLDQSVFADQFGNWTTNQVSSNLFGLSSVVHGNGVYVAAGTYSDYGAIISSEDGLNWTLRINGHTSGSGAPTWGIRCNYSGGRFISTGAWGATAVSTNGTNWTVAYASDLYLYGGTYGNGKYVAVGQRESGTPTINNIVTSADGITWTSHRSHPTGTEAGIIADVAYGAGAYVAIGAGDGYKYRSVDATVWIRTPIAGGSAISFCNGLFIVPYVAETNLLSSDGSTFVAVNTGITNMIGKVIFVNNLFMARTANHLVTSVDGTNWIQYPGNLPGVGVASDGVRLVTVGQERVTVPFFQNWNGFVHTSDSLVGLRLVDSAPTIELSGLVGRSYRIDYTETFAIPGTNNWQTLTNVQLPSNPLNLPDLSATNSPQRFYRAALLP